MAALHESSPQRVLRRRLGELRKEANMSQAEAATHLGWSESKLSRMESGSTGIKPTDAKVLAELYGRPELGLALLELGKQAKAKNWWHDYAPVIPEWLHAYISLESTAASIRVYETQLIPGILQTPDYARTVIKYDNPTDSTDEIESRVKLRIERQTLLTRTEPSTQQWHILMSEAVLRRPVGGPEVMRAQLEKLLEIMQLPNVTLGAVPIKAGMHAGLNTGHFVLLDFPINGISSEPSEPTTVYVEGFTGALYTEKTSNADRYHAAFKDIANTALDPESTQALIATAIEEMTT